MKKITKKLNRIAVKDADSKYRIENVIKKVRKELGIEDFSNDEVECLRHTLLDEREHIINNGGTAVITFNFCECECDCACRGQNDYDLYSEISFTDLHTFDDTPYDIQTVDQFNYFEQDKFSKKLIEINKIAAWNDIENKTRSLEEFKRFLPDVKNHKNAEKIIKRYNAICDEVEINKAIIKYNDGLTKLINENKYAAQCKEIMKDLTGEDHLTCAEIEIADGVYEELNINLFMDTCWVTERGDSFNVTYEGASIFGEAYLSHIDHFNKEQVKTFARIVCDAVEEARILPHMYELSRDDNFGILDDEEQKMLSTSEVATKLERQLYLLTKRADMIFGNVMKLLKIVQTQKVLSEEIK